MRFGNMEASPNLADEGDGTTMELEVGSEGGGSHPHPGAAAALNRKIAITVVALSVFAGLLHIRDEETVQSMDRAEAHAIDTWNEYQATRTKLHVAETARLTLSTLAGESRAQAALAALDSNIAKYKAESPDLTYKAQAEETQYKALNRSDDAFHLAEAVLSIAVSLAAVASLLEAGWLLYAAWAFGAAGLGLGLAAYVGLGL